MCASYGLDPRFGDYASFARINDQEILERLRSWAESNAGETLRPTGKNLKNLNPIIRDAGNGPELELAWWGYLVGGEPSKFPSINTRSERLQQKPGSLAGRALVPATSWLEMQKPSRTWYRFETGDLELFSMAAVTQRGVPTGGDPVTCYSIIMQPARDDQVEIHDRMPLLLPADFSEEWLSADEPGTRELMDAALEAGREMTSRVRATRAVE
jgi:putative SOS response-associated peptidase YedK